MGDEDRLESYICTQCGAQFAPTAGPPESCPVSEEEREYIPEGGQKWTTLPDLQKEHRSSFVEEEARLLGIGMEPSFAIGQRALLVQTPRGNVLWDCISLIDDAAIDRVGDLGGIDAIAVSHPHYYSSMVEWSHALGAPVYLHRDDRHWVMRDDPAIEYWDGETLDLVGGCSLIHCGGHFAGGTVLHWPDGAGGKGALLSGDIVQVIPDRRWVSFMYSYPNLIPLPEKKILRIVQALEPYDFDRIHGAWFRHVVSTDGKRIVERSAERYIDAITGDGR